jgi:hypothetical protein
MYPMSHTHIQFPYSTIPHPIISDPITTTIMYLPTLLILLTAWATTSSAALTWTLARASSPTADQTDAYARITLAMQKAVARYAKYSSASKTIHVAYAPGVPTAEANYNGDLRFGSNRAYMNERTAMHEISHTLGVGQTAAFDRKCAAGDWKTALPLLRGWDGASAKISCGGSHFWPYGLNYDTEWSETNANRHVQIVQAMLQDGM